MPKKVSKPRKRQYTKVCGESKEKSIIFRGERYWFYTDSFLKGVRDFVSGLRKKGFKVRLIRPALSVGIVDIYTNPKHPGKPIRHFSRLHY